MTISVIVELHAKPGRRADLNTFLEAMVTEHGPSQSGFLGSSRYAVVDDPDLLVEIAEWQSADAREAHMEKAVATGAYAPLTQMLAAPFRATVIRALT